MKKDPIKVG